MVQLSCCRRECCRSLLLRRGASAGRRPPLVASLALGPLRGTRLLVLPLSSAWLRCLSGASFCLFSSCHLFTSPSLTTALRSAILDHAFPCRRCPFSLGACLGVALLSAATTAVTVWPSSWSTENTGAEQGDGAWEEGVGDDSMVRLLCCCSGLFPSTPFFPSYRLP